MLRMAPHKLTSRVIATEDALREIIGHPTDIVCAKVGKTLNPLTRQFIERSPFLCIATHGADGTCDVSPRGDPPGFGPRPRGRLADQVDGSGAVAGRGWEGTGASEDQRQPGMSGRSPCHEGTGVDDLPCWISRSSERGVVPR